MNEVAYNEPADAEQPCNHCAKDEDWRCSDRDERQKACDSHKHGDTHKIHDTGEEPLTL